MQSSERSGKVELRNLMGAKEAPKPRAASIARILVALDASPHSRAALAAAVELSAALGAELVGIYVEDISLLRMAQLRVSVEVGSASGRVRRVDERRVSYALRSQAERARKALQRTARIWGVRWSFEVLRGAIARQLLEAAVDADLVILGRVGWSDKPVLGSTAESLLSEAPQRTLLLAARHQLPRNLLALYDGSEISARALDTAAELSRQAGRYLTVAIVADDADQARVLQSEAAAYLQTRQVEYQVRWLVAANRLDLQQMLGGPGSTALIVPAENRLFSGRSLREAVQQMDCPVLVVR